MKIIKDNEDILIVEMPYKGSNICLYINKVANEVEMNVDEAIAALGYADNFKEFIESDRGLDTINSFHKRFPNEKFFGDLVIQNKFIIKGLKF